MNYWYLLALWVLVSLPFGVVVGHLIAFGGAGDDEAPERVDLAPGRASATGREGAAPTAGEPVVLGEGASFERSASRDGRSEPNFARRTAC